MKLKKIVWMIYIWSKQELIEGIESNVGSALPECVLLIIAILHLLVINCKINGEIKLGLFETFKRQHLDGDTENNICEINQADWSSFSLQFLINQAFSS